jgi:hypothetical protein
MLILFAAAAAAIVQGDGRRGGLLICVKSVYRFSFTAVFVSFTINLLLQTLPFSFSFPLLCVNGYLKY